MKIYVAAAFPQQKTDAAQMRELLLGAGHSVTSRWLDVEASYDKDEGTRMREYAVDDEEDVREAKLMVVLTGDPRTRGGRHSEVGMAIILKMPILLLGPREQVFHHHPLVRQFNDHASLMAYISGLESL